MPGFISSLTNSEDAVFAANADFTTLTNQNPLTTNGLQTNGQMWIGTTAVNAGGTHINVGSITSPLGTLNVGFSSPNITLDLAGGTVGVDSFAVDTGTSPVFPTAAGLLTLTGATVASGTNPIRTDGTVANTIAIEVQRSQALAAADSTKVGLSNFDSASFAVSANGFVTLLSTGFSPNSTVQLFDDFTGTQVGGFTGDNSIFSNLLWRQTTAATAFGGGTNTAVSGHPGVIYSVAGAVNQGMILSNSAVTATTPQFFIGDGVTVINWVIKIATLSSGNRYTLRFGFGDTLTGDLVNGVYFEYVDNVNSGNWQLKTAKASARTTTNTTTAADTSWHNFQITINAAGTSAEYFIDGVSKGTIATNLPVVTISPFLTMTFGGGSIVDGSVIVDLFYLTKTLTTPR